MHPLGEGPRRGLHRLLVPVEGGSGVRDDVLGKGEGRLELVHHLVVWHLGERHLGTARLVEELL